MTTQKFRESVLARLSAATPGPWRLRHYQSGTVYVGMKDGDAPRGEYDRGYLGAHITLFNVKDFSDSEESLQRERWHNGDLIAHAPTDLAIAMRIIECYEAVLQGIAIDPLYNERVVAEAREALATAEKIAGGKDATCSVCVPAAEVGEVRARQRACDCGSEGGCMTVQSLLAEIESRLNAATAGPWHIGHVSEIADGEFSADIDGPNGEQVAASYFRANEPLIAHAPTDLALLLAIVRTYEAALKKAADNVTWVAPAADGENQIILTYGYHVEACQRALATAEKIAGGEE